MGKYGFGLSGMLNEEMMEQADMLAARQRAEQTEMAEKEIYDAEFALGVSGNLYVIYGILSLMCIGLAAKTLLKTAIRAYDSGAMLNVAYFTVGEKTAMIMSVLLAALFISVLVCFKVKKMPYVRQSVLYYKGNQYHALQITQIKVWNRSVAKVYIDGKYVFWLTADLENYYRFLSWARKCGVVIIGETESQDSHNLGTESTMTKQTVVMIFAVVVFAAVCIGTLFYVMV